MLSMLAAFTSSTLNLASGSGASNRKRELEVVGGGDRRGLMYYLNNRLKTMYYKSTKLDIKEENNVSRKVVFHLVFHQCSDAKNLAT